MTTFKTLGNFSFALTAFLVLAPGLASTATENDQQPPAEAALVAEGRALSQQFLEHGTDAIWARMSPEMHEALGSAQALADFRKQIGAQLGKEISVLDERTQQQQGARIYLRTAQWSKAPVPVAMQWALDGNGQIIGFFVRPVPQAAPSQYLDYQTKANLRLPFKGNWYVFWGGRTLEQNYHAVNPGQRFAYDFVKMVDGSTHRGDGQALEDYYCWNAPILAPADGRVIETVTDLPDQPIGTTNTEAPSGNHVMLDLGQGEYALFAHLQQGSVRVTEGDTVTAGQVLGLCGNSGNTSEPHLHFHLQDSPKFGEGAGLPAQFNDYTADGKPVERGEPLRGQAIAPGTGSGAP